MWVSPLPVSTWPLISRFWMAGFHEGNEWWAFDMRTMKTGISVVLTFTLVDLVGSFGSLLSFNIKSFGRTVPTGRVVGSSVALMSSDVTEDVASSESLLSLTADPWEVYESMVYLIKEKVRVSKGGANAVDLSPALHYLTSKEHILEPPPLDQDFQDNLRDQKDKFMAKTNLTSIQYGYATKVLAYIGDFCAKRQEPRPLAIAWRKLLESGVLPRENTISTYMYALALDVHDLLFEPNEKTVALRIKGHISSGDAVGAEVLLQTLPSNDWTRLRTYLPILYYYCDKGDLSSVLRLYRQMRNSPGVHFDADTYAVLIGAIAENGGFRQDATPIVGSFESGFAHTHGPRLFDEIAQEMADDILEIKRATVQVLYNAFIRGFKDVLPSAEPLLDDTDLLSCNDPASANELILNRVAVDDATGVCARTRAKLQLFQLDSVSRQHMEMTLQSMAKDQFVDFQQKLNGKSAIGGGQAKMKKPPEDFDPDYPVLELRNFTKWLKERDGVFTAIVDGANIAYFGHGTVRYSQIQHVVAKLEAMNERPLVVMPFKYLQPKFLASVGKVQVLSEKDHAVIDRLDKEGKLYRVPPKCLDDYYWMIASIVGDDHTIVEATNNDGRFPGVRPMLVTNDQMRDHKLELLEPRLFRRWCCCHIVNYNFPDSYNDEWEERTLEFLPADVVSREIQGNPLDSVLDENECGSLSWHFPVSEWNEHERFCIRIP
jgi:pentatricopeptide repeat protein